MISDMAIGEIERMQKAGLKPTAEDIVRLNALGLNVEYVTRPGDLMALPRTSSLGDLYFREPTIAHDMWIEEALVHVERSHYPTYLTVVAFALSRSQNLLPDAADRKAVAKALKKFSKTMLAGFTFHQVRCAVMYAMHGPNQVELEYPAPADEDEDRLAICSDAPRSVGAGVLMMTASMSLGVSVREIMSMTTAQALELRKLAMIRQGYNMSKCCGADASDKFFRTVAEIEERLKKEKGT